MIIKHEEITDAYYEFALSSFPKVNNQKARPLLFLTPELSLLILTREGKNLPIHARVLSTK